MSAEAQERHKKLLEHFELQKRARSLVVPTKDAEVRAKLRELGEPITLFGEGPPERRNRLREILARMGIETGEPAPETGEEKDKQKSKEDEYFFYEGPPELHAARLFIAKYSLPRAQERIKQQKRQREEEEAKEMLLDPEKIKERDAQPDEVLLLYERLKKYENAFSEVGDERTLSACAISLNCSTIATASWTGLIKLWNRENLQLINTLRSHRERVSSVAWHPEAGGGQMSAGVNLASGSADATVRLWSLESAAPIATLQGHKDRVNRVAFHPSGRFVGSTSFDTTWYPFSLLSSRSFVVLSFSAPFLICASPASSVHGSLIGRFRQLWDVETQKSLLIQEGHSRAVYGIAFQCDGSLVATTGVDAIGRVWDLRIGKSIVVLQGHVKVFATSTLFLGVIRVCFWW